MLAAWKSEEPIAVKNVYQKGFEEPVKKGPTEWMHSIHDGTEVDWLNIDSGHQCLYKNLPAHFFCFKLGGGEPHKFFSVQHRAIRQLNAIYL